MLIIRLQRIGKPKKAYFRLVVTEHTTRPHGKYIELLGTYDPHLKILQAKKERIAYWQSQGVQMSPTARNLLINKEIIKGEKAKSWRPKIKKGGATESAAPAAAPAPAPAA
ncbi:MAG: 30S ribosomal protein S16 [Candidatus Yanofskybacteria bacterium RIFCSPLOWO2_01_FULL_49_25]|uniref:Small ribosomal subunit protein bS16 n=1 Tax=Candidatus Yanofskybacteria bacterium RIFCSPLOWO2_01_FULL_49_25 TaxID=1802701 RepID=A0A1F8GWP3_9BACT|nr:MAG: 30S ribosomal protein S16 [Candidatus Yanofskybacteria bacterium RIFCSPLOWO2_01_FULL_49_25]